MLAGCGGPSGDVPATPPSPPPDHAESSATGTAPTLEPPNEITSFGRADALADVLIAAERALADPATPGGQRNRWAWAQQQAYRDLAVNPGWRDEVRSRVPKWLRRAFDLNLRAGVELRRLSPAQSKIPSDWRILPPPPVDELRGYYVEAESASGVPWSVLAAIHLVETRFGRIHGDSHAGAQGPMQFMPDTWRVYGRGDVRDPRDAILAAGRYLHAHGAPKDLRRALFAYNRSDRYVKAVLAHAEAMRRYPHYLDTYHRWRVYYRTDDGDVVLEEGYGS